MPMNDIASVSLAQPLETIADALGRSFAEYWESRPGPLRTTLKRKAKKVETEVLTHFDPAVWAEYEAIYAASWKPAEDQPAMLRAFAAVPIAPTAS